MRALSTAPLLPDYFDQLSSHIEIHQTGFALGGNLMGEDELIRKLVGQDIFIISYEEITKNVIRQSPDLKLIASIRGGPEANIDIKAATTAGIPVLYTIGRTDHAASEYVMALMLAMARPLHKADQHMRDGSLMDMGDTGEDEISGEVELNTAERDVVWPLEPETPAYQVHQQLFGL